MANPSKEKGTKAETKVVRFLNERDWDARRQPLSGNKDKGDILATPLFDAQYQQYIIEVKAGKQCSNPTRKNLEEWMRQAEVEARNAFPGMGVAENKWILVVVRYNRKIEDADVYVKNGIRNIEHCWLDQINSMVGR